MGGLLISGGKNESQSYDMGCGVGCSDVTRTGRGDQESNQAVSCMVHASVV